MLVVEQAERAADRQFPSMSQQSGQHERADPRSARSFINALLLKAVVEEHLQDQRSQSQQLAQTLRDFTVGSCMSVAAGMSGIKTGFAGTFRGSANSGLLHDGIPTAHDPDPPMPNLSKGSVGLILKPFSLKPFYG